MPFQYFVGPCETFRMGAVSSIVCTHARVCVCVRTCACARRRMYMCAFVCHCVCMCAKYYACVRVCVRRVRVYVCAHVLFVSCSTLVPVLQYFRGVQHRNRNFRIAALAELMVQEGRLLPAVYI